MRSMRPERFPGTETARSNAPLAPAAAPSATIHRISRRSMSKHPGHSPTPPLAKLQKRLKPEWEVDYLDESSDDKVEQALTKLTDSEYNSLQELRLLSTLSDEDDIDVAGKIEKLGRYRQILTESRSSLRPLADYLDKFGQELNKLSQEMEFLQKRSNSLNSESDDKKLLDVKLTPLINDLVIPPDVVKSIVQSPVNGSWVENLRFLQEKRAIYSKYEQGTAVGPKSSIHELSRLLEMLEDKCVERIRNYLVSQIKRLRRTNTPSQVVQKEMLECKEIYTYLQERNSKLAAELYQAYLYTMRWYYHQNFVKYLSSLEKLHLTTIDQAVLLDAVEGEQASRGGFFSRAQPVSEVSINEYLINIPKRLESLASGDQTAMPAQIAETNRTKYWIETGFRQFNQALLDNVSTEYLFLNEFFKVSTLEAATDSTRRIFSTIYQLGYNYTKSLIANSYDLFGVLIMVRLCQSLEYELQHRRVPILEDYFNYQLIILWPKFQQLIDQNCSAMKRAASLTSVIKSLSKNTMAPLTLTQNFGTILTSLIRLSSNLMFEVETWEPLTQSVIRLSNEFESCMIKLSANIQGKKKREVFLYNNFFLIYTILCEEIDSDDQEKSLADTEKDHFSKLIAAYGE